MLKIYIISYETPEYTNKLYNVFKNTFNSKLFVIDVIHNGNEENNPTVPFIKQDKNYGYDKTITMLLSKHKKNNDIYDAY